MTTAARDDEERRCHAVRIGMSLYWLDTYPEDGGYAYVSQRTGVSGWRPGDRGNAIKAAREALLAREESAR